MEAGANLITITGAVLDYDDDWAGRYLNTEVTLLKGDYKRNEIIFFAPNANWKF